MNRGLTLVTGATGFVGHVLLAELMRRGHRCGVLLRAPASDGLERLAELLEELNVPASDVRRLEVVEGALPDGLPDRALAGVTRLVHAAASTRFDLDPGGEPLHTNDAGTAALLERAAHDHVRELHFVSTAFVCGAARGAAPERIAARPPEFHNAYEQSKWLAERSVRAWALRTGGRCTIHRPSIVVGDHATGRATRFAGLYLSLRAGEILAHLAGRDPQARQHIPLRIEGRGSDRVNVVAVDHVARFIANVVDSPAHQGAVYHIVHPEAPTNTAIRRSIERAFGIGGGRFVDPAEFPGDDLNDVERAFHAAVRPVRPYLIDSPRFDRRAAAAVESHFDDEPPPWDDAALDRLIDYARRCGWGRRRSARTRAGDEPARYFEEFLPRAVGRSAIARMAALTTTVRFVIEDVPRGEWVCRFEQGRLVEVLRGINGVREQFGYRTSTEGFWDIVTARCDPQQVFLEGRAEMTGDVEQALKMGFILRDFNRAHPFRPRREGTKP